MIKSDIERVHERLSIPTLSFQEEALFIIARALLNIESMLEKIEEDLYNLETKNE